MAETIIFLTISLLVSLIFVILGISQYKSKTPVTINTGLTPPREDELTSVSEWNHRHGRNYILLGCALFITLVVFAYLLKACDNVGLCSFILLAAVFGEIAFVVIDHNVMMKKMIKRR